MPKKIENFLGAKNALRFSARWERKDNIKNNIKFTLRTTTQKFNNGKYNNKKLIKSKLTVKQNDR